MYALYFLSLTVLYLSIGRVYPFYSHPLREVTLKDLFLDPLQTKRVSNEYEEWSVNRYKWMAVAVGYKLKRCIDTCVNGTCIINWDYYDGEASLRRKRACKIASPETAPVYFTSRLNDKNIAVCLGLCEKHDPNDDYERCLVSKDKDNRNAVWDFCSTKIYSYTRRVYLTEHSEICNDECTTTLYESKCMTLLNVTEKCDPNLKVDFIQAYTVHGDPCVTPCYKYTPIFTTRYHYQCKDSKKRIKFCAPPALRSDAEMETMYQQMHSPFESNDFRYEVPYTESEYFHS